MAIWAWILMLSHWLSFYVKKSVYKTLCPINYQGFSILRYFVFAVTWLGSLILCCIMIFKGKFGQALAIVSVHTLLSVVLQAPGWTEPFFEVIPWTIQHILQKTRRNL